MKNVATLFALILAVVLAVPAVAQSVIVGTQRATANFNFPFTAPVTLIDLSNPATADGTLTRASLNWYAFEDRACVGAFKIRFLRPADPPRLTTFTLVGERGPFTARPGVNIVPITPGIAVKKGDLIAVASLQPLQTCGAPWFSKVPTGVSMAVAGDVTSGSFNGTFLRGQVLLARATDTDEVLEGVLTVVGSLQGAFGSFFRTSVQISAPAARFDETVTGKLVFRRAGVPASPSDPVRPYTITGSNVESISDVVQAMGLSGLGSIDVISTSGAPPVIRTRVYTDNGAAGTLGFTQDMVTREDALEFGDHAVLLTPADLTNFRVNIGIRTFESPVTLFVRYGTRGQEERTFPANTFEQIPLASLTSFAPLPNERLTFSILGSGGDVSIYASTTDNRTNDSSIQFLRRE